jgi:hypothetical protein
MAIILIVVASVLISLLQGCASMGVEVWERDVLAKPTMSPYHDAVDRAIDDHIYFSKEAASGGRGFGGGGCGCN